jgi:hypothetical protein
MCYKDGLFDSIHSTCRTPSFAVTLVKAGSWWLAMLFSGLRMELECFTVQEHLPHCIERNRVIRDGMKEWRW